MPLLHKHWVLHENFQQKMSNYISSKLKMLESQPQDALVKLVKLIKLYTLWRLLRLWTVQTVDTV